MLHILENFCWIFPSPNLAEPSGGWLSCEKVLKIGYGERRVGFFEKLEPFKITWILRELEMLWLVRYIEILWFHWIGLYHSQKVSTGWSDCLIDLLTITFQFYQDCRFQLSKQKISRHFISPRWQRHVSGGGEWGGALAPIFTKISESSSSLPKTVLESFFLYLV